MGPKTLLNSLTKIRFRSLKPKTKIPATPLHGPRQNNQNNPKSLKCVVKQIPKKETDDVTTLRELKASKMEYRKEESQRGFKDEKVFALVKCRQHVTTETNDTHK